MTDAKLKCTCYITILETIQLCANKQSLVHLKILSKKYAFTSHISNICMYVCMYE